MGWQLSVQISNVTIYTPMLREILPKNPTVLDKPVQNKIELWQCINQGQVDDDILWLLWKGIVIDPFKCAKCEKFYWKHCMDLVLTTDICKDGMKGCISYHKSQKLDVDEVKIETDIKWRSTNFVYASKDVLRKLSSLKFKWSYCNPENEISKKKSQMYAYSVFIKHLANHVNPKKTNYEEKRVKIRSEPEKEQRSRRRDTKKGTIKDSSKTNQTSSASKKDKKPTAPEDIDNPFFESGAWTLCFHNVKPEEYRSHIALYCPELEEVCQYCNSLIKRRDLISHFVNCPESYIECPDWEHLLKKGQNMQSHYCRRKEFDLHNLYMKLENLQKTLDENRATFYELLEKKTTLEYKTEGLETCLEDRKDEFLMKFEKKELDEILNKVDKRFTQLFKEQKQKAALEPQNFSRNGSILEERIVKFQKDVIRGLYPFYRREDIMSPNWVKDNSFITKNNGSVWIWNLELQRCIVTIQICDITQRDKQLYVIDKCTIVDNDLLVIIIRSKKASKILVYKIPTIEELQSLDIDEITYSDTECIGSHQFQGIVSVLKDSLFDPDKFYIIVDWDNKFTFKVMQICEEVKEEEKPDITAKINEIHQIELTKEALDICDWPTGPLKNHMIFLYGRHYEIHAIKLDEYKDLDYKSMYVVQGNYGILLPPNLIEYYHRVVPFDVDQYLFIGSTKIEVRKITVERRRSAYECSDDIICTVSLPAESAVDREDLNQMEQPWYSSFNLFHKGRTTLLEWSLTEQNKLDFKNIWENSSNWSFIFSFYNPSRKQAVMVDMNNNLSFIKFADVKHEL